jgi:hypothetical protein
MLWGGQQRHEAEAILAALAAGHIKVLYAAPEKLLSGPVLRVLQQAAPLPLVRRCARLAPAALRRLLLTRCAGCWFAAAAAAGAGCSPHAVASGSLRCAPAACPEAIALNPWGRPPQGAALETALYACPYPACLSGLRDPNCTADLHPRGAAAHPGKCPLGQP